MMVNIKSNVWTCRWIRVDVLDGRDKKRFDMVTENTISKKWGDLRSSIRLSSSRKASGKVFSDWKGRCRRDVCRCPQQITVSLMMAHISGGGEKKKRVLGEGLFPQPFLTLWQAGNSSRSKFIWCRFNWSGSRLAWNRKRALIQPCVPNNDLSIKGKKTKKTKTKNALTHTPSSADPVKSSSLSVCLSGKVTLVLSAVSDCLILHKPQVHSECLSLSQYWRKVWSNLK